MLIVALSIAAVSGVSAPVRAQRHGRPDAVQMYARSTRPPELQIQWTSRPDVDRWRARDLEAMGETSVVVPRSKHPHDNVFSGALLNDLFANHGVGDDALVEVHFGWFHKKTLNWQDLDPDHTIVVTRRNGTRLPNAWWLVTVDTQGRPTTIKAVTKVVVRTK